MRCHGGATCRMTLLDFLDSDPFQGEYMDGSSFLLQISRAGVCKTTPGSSCNPKWPPHWDSTQLCASTQSPGGMDSWGYLLICGLQRSVRKVWFFRQSCITTHCLPWLKMEASLAPCCSWQGGGGWDHYTPPLFVTPWIELPI